MCCEHAIQNDQMVHTISFLRHVEPNLCPGVRSLHCQLGDKPSVSIDSWLQATGLRPRDVERAPEVTRALPAGGRLPVHRHAAMPAPRQLAARQPGCLQRSVARLPVQMDVALCWQQCKPGREEEGSLLGSHSLFVTSFLRRLKACWGCPVSFGQKYLVFCKK